MREAAPAVQGIRVLFVVDPRLILRRNRGLAIAVQKLQ
jgi:hypothetical protein